MARKKQSRPRAAPDKPLSPAALQARMERVMREIGKLDMGDMTAEQADAYLQEQLASGRFDKIEPETPLEQAQELVYEAWDATGKRRVDLARRALEISPDCADAYIILAEETRTPEEARDVYQKAVEAGERAIGPEGFREYEGHFWGVIETRPYMRARLELAELLWLQGETAAAAEHLNDMLRLNPSDNQGVRYLLMACLIESDRDQEAMALLNRFKDDASSGWAYDRALLAFRKSGESHRADRALNRALEANVFVPLYILGLAPPPREAPDFVGIGDEAEAIDYAMTAHRSWAHQPEAADWLARAWGAEILGMLRTLHEGLDALEGVLDEDDEDTLDAFDTTPDDEATTQPGS